MHDVLISGEWFTDEKKRKMLLRGSNILCKTPDETIPNISFTGNPFELDEVDDHFERLRYWGFNCLRYTVTWEAVEHLGPGLYDTDFLDYLEQVIECAGRHDLFVFIDFHQDVWSRFTGGCGAPLWTLELAGFDTSLLAATGAVSFPKNLHHDHLIWPTNAFKLGAATMFTLFFGGSIFAPKLMIDNENIQSYLQRHYANSMKQVAKRLSRLSNVIGYEVMNEPLRGYIEWKDLRNYEGFFSLGDCPTAFQSMLLGVGEVQYVEKWKKTAFGLKSAGLHKFDPKGKKAWKKDCIWKEHGVWHYNKNGDPELLIPDYFLYYKNRRVQFTDDFYRPFVRYIAEEVRSIKKDAIIFVENEMYHKPPTWGVQDPMNIVFSTHWYDAYVLALKRFNPFLGVDMLTKQFIIALPPKMRHFFFSQIERLKSLAGDRIGKIPTMITEFGIAFDMYEKKAYKTGNYSKQIQALNRSFQAIEDNLLSCTIWNYYPRHNHEKGDHWNAEDFSIFSSDQAGDRNGPYYGARAKHALIRPYAVYTPGTPKSMSFDIKKAVFAFSFTSDSNAQGELEIFIPKLHYPKGIVVKVSDGSYRYEEENQKLFYLPSNKREDHFILIRPH
ncbi:MAG: hypothetical protein FJZ56_01810 [Chlamydiae bacterium]|nr:hypothetical protein [Chlamydiota bacterium]